MSWNNNAGGGWGDDSGVGNETWATESQNSGLAKKAGTNRVTRDTGVWGEVQKSSTSMTKKRLSDDGMGGAVVADHGWGSTGGGEGGEQIPDEDNGIEDGEDEEACEWEETLAKLGIGVAGGNSKGDAYDMDSIRIAPVTWANQELEQIKGYDYEEHAAVQELSEEDVTAWRNSWHMNVECSDPYAAIPKPIRSFEESKLPEDILDLIDASRGGAFENPTAIQSQGWPFIMTGKDVIGIAQTGSGKTLTFILPAVVHIRKNPKKKNKCPIAMIQAPTRELARQIGVETRKYSTGVKVGHTFGGEPRRDQEPMLKEAHLIVGTPGRTMDHIANHAITLRYTTYIVLDEADRMLDMGFQPQVEKIFKCVRLRRQLLLFTATWLPALHDLASKLFRMDWLKVTIGALTTNANHNVDQRFIFIAGQHEKKDKLLELLALEEFKGKKTLIFVKTRHMADEVCMFLRTNKIATVALHGGREQRVRDIIVSDYKKGVRLRTLIATDVAQRGLHVDDISLVINFDYPHNVEDYVHRIGRTARRGMKGVSITMFNMFTEHQHVEELVKVLREARQPVPEQFTCKGNKYLVNPGPHRRIFNENSGRAVQDSKRICYDFQKGSCSRGAACRYSHEVASDKRRVVA